MEHWNTWKTLASDSEQKIRNAKRRNFVDPCQSSHSAVITQNSKTLFRSLAPSDLRVFALFFSDNADLTTHNDDAEDGVQEWQHFSMKGRDVGSLLREMSKQW